MSLTRLAGAWSSAACFANRTLPLASRSSTASALSVRRRAFWAQAGPATTESNAPSRRIPSRTALGVGRRTGIILLSARAAPKEKPRRGYRTARLSRFEGLKRGRRPPAPFLGPALPRVLSPRGLWGAGGGGVEP